MFTKEQIQTKSAEELAEIVLSLQEEKEQQQKRINYQVETIQQLMEKLKLSRHKQFGKKSERHAEESPQALLFDEADFPVNTDEIEKADEEITIPAHTRKKQTNKVGRKPLPESLSREEHIYDLAEAEKKCDCGCEMKCIGDERSEQLKIIPAKISVIVHVRKKYACKSCSIGVKQARMEPQPIPKSIAGPELLAHINIAKFEDYQPLYRQERIMNRIGIDIPRATLSNWVIKSSKLLQPLYNLLQDHIQNYDVASADETKLQVLREPGREAEKQSYMWVFGGGPPEQRVFLYHYSPSRSASVVEDMLGDFKGYLQTDGYCAYTAFAKDKDGISNVGCWYHLRRYFSDTEKLSTKTGLATEALRFIKKLSKIERKGRTLKPEGRRLLRQCESKTIIKTFKSWLTEHAPSVSPNTKLGEGFTYAFNQWDSLIKYLEDGRLEFSNNHTERAIKPFVMGRKNWLFANSVAGANAAAIIYSIIETCKANHIKTYEYLAYAFKELPKCSVVEDYEALLPFNLKQKFTNKR